MVGHKETHGVAFYAQPYRSSRAARVPVHIGKAFLNGAKYGNFQFDGQPPQSLRQVQIHSDATSLREAISKPANGGQQTHLVEHWRMQQMREGADLFDAAINKFPALRNCVSSAVIQIRGIARKVRKIHLHCGENLAE